MEDSNTISQLLETIQSFKIVKCNMHHEKVAIDANGNPIQKSQDDELFFDRVNLCDPKHRNVRLGCAHSGVNIKFERVLDLIKTELPQKANQISDFKTEFGSVVSQIYTLDHKVGNLEHELAICRLTSNDDKHESLMATMNSLKSEHHSLMDGLSKIKSDIEQLIKSEVNYKTL